MNLAAMCIGYGLITVIVLLFIAVILSILIDQLTFAWCVMRGYKSLKMREGQSIRVFYEALKFGSPNPGAEMRTKDGVFICKWNSFKDWEHA